MQRLITAFFSPATYLMNRLRYPRKLALLAFIMAVPVGLFMYILVAQVNGRIESAHKERTGLGYLRAVTVLMRDVQQHRALANAYISGDTKVKESLSNKQAEIENDIKMVDRIDVRLGAGLGTTQRWSILKEKWDGIRSGFPVMSPESSFDVHTSYIKGILDLMRDIAGVSNMIADRDNHYLIDSIVDKIPRAFEYAAQTKALGETAAFSKRFGEAERTHLLVVSDVIRLNLEEAGKNLEKAVQENPSQGKDLEKPLNDIRHYVAELQRLYGKLLGRRIIAALPVKPSRYPNLLGRKASPAGAWEYFSALAGIINAGYEANEKIMDVVGRILGEQENEMVQKRNFIFGGTAFFILLLIYLFLGLYFTVTRSLDGMVKASGEMTAGRLDARVTITSRDEMAFLAESFNEMARSLSERTGQLTHKTEELEKSNTELEHFASIASHDLQSPLLAVASNLKLLEKRIRDNLDEECKGFLNDSLESAMRMQELIRNLLAYSRVQTKAMPFVKIDSSRALEAALKNLSLAIERSGARITAGLLPQITADSTQIAQLFQNLIGNAIKYRGEGVLHIDINSEKKNDEWVFSVSDNGLGISDEDIAKIFEIFYRVEGKKPGAGIGLATCKRIVERHGGRIWVESTQGKGSIFYFTIPESSRESP